MAKAKVKYHRRTVTVKTEFGRVSIEVFAEVQSGHLTRDEQTWMIDAITSSNMQTLSGAPYIKAPLSKLKVS
jgi:hypothetical protein